MDVCGISAQFFRSRRAVDDDFFLRIILAQCTNAALRIGRTPVGKNGMTTRAIVAVSHRS